MAYQNEMKIIFDARSINEGFARLAVAAFITDLNPTLEEISDIKTAVSEAVTNAIIHAYSSPVQQVILHCSIRGNEVEIIVSDQGVGIEDVKRAMEPFYTTKPELERSGMGFSFMEAFMDKLEVVSEVGKGTQIRMTRKIGSRES